MRNLGLHIRWSESIFEVVWRAQELHLSTTQCFLTSESSGAYAQVSPEHQKDFRLLCSQAGLKALFAHASYRINIADEKQHHYLLDREIALAEQLGFSHLILHPGASPLKSKRTESIAMLARMLNALAKRELPVTIVLENVAFAGKALGGDLHDFYLVRERLEYPEKLFFCIDTAHAFSYGYDLISSAGREHFIEKIDTLIGCTQIAVLHGNDTNAARGSRMDSHAILGRGVLGEEAVKAIAMHQKLACVPLICELPSTDNQTQQAVVTMLRNW